MAHTRLNPQEWLFLQMAPAGVHWYAVIAGLCDPPAGEGRPTVESLIALAASRLHFVPSRFRQRVLPSPLGIAPPVWADDADFDLRHHIRSAELGSEASHEDFERLCGRLATAPIDMRRPPWDVHLAERVDGDRVGFVIRGHHCMLDGANMAAFVGLIADLDPAADPPPEPKPWAPEPEPTRTALLREELGAARRRVRFERSRPGSGNDGPAEGGGGSADRRFSLGGARETLTALREQFAPFGSRTMFNRRPSDAREVDFIASDLESLKAVGHAHGATLNDVAAAAVCDGLRRFYLERGRLPEARIKLLVPISYDPAHSGEASGDASEHVGFMNVVLPLEEGEVGRRIERVAEQTRAAKEGGEADQVDALMRRVADESDHLYRIAQHMVQSPHGAALTLSNVRGPDFPVYVRGARVRELYPLIPLGPRHDLAVGAISLERSFFFAVVRSPRSNRALAPFGEAMREAVSELASEPQPEGNPG